MGDKVDTYRKKYCFIGSLLLVASFLLMGAAASGHAATPSISNVTATDVADTQFSVVWASDVACTGTLQIFSDAGATQEITGSLTLDYQSDDHAPAEDNGVMKVTVTGLESNTLYYFRIVTISSEGVLVEPALGELPSVHTEIESQLVENDVIAHKILQNDGTTPATGGLLLAQLEGASYPITGWVGDGVSDPSYALVDLNNFYSEETHMNLESCA